MITATGVLKHYQALRPLRLTALTIERGQVISLLGLDAAAAEMLVGLLTGAILPDDGEILLFGRSTRDITDSDAWLAMLDAVGIVTGRAVLIAQFSVEQNLAMPFTLQVEPVAEETRLRVQRLAAEVGLDERLSTQPVAQAAPEAVARVRLARALALDPQVLLVEHPSASLPVDQVKGYAVDLARVAKQRGLAVLAITADRVFAKALGGEILVHDPVSGALHRQSAWQRWLA